MQKSKLKCINFLFLVRILYGDFMEYFIYFIFYSFIGFLLETIYSLLSTGTFILKKCFLFNYLCPVYGFGAISILFCTKNIKEYKILTMIVGGLIATVVEFIVHYVYKELIGVSIWDYSDLYLNIQGRVCLTFTLYWILLSGVLVYLIHPFVQKNMLNIPNSIAVCILIFVAIDGILSILLYNKFGHKDAVNFNWLISNYLHKFG